MNLGTWLIIAATLFVVGAVADVTTGASGNALTTVLLIACALAATLFIIALVIGWWSTTPRNKTKGSRK